jgi:RNA recognition motif-containing protein
MNLFVGNLSDDTMEEELQKAFAPFGAIRSVTIVRDRYSGASRGFGFVEMASRQEGMAAISGLAGERIKGQLIRVSEAQPREDRRRSDGRTRRNGGSW